MAEAPGRVIVATFASLIARVQQIIDAAVKHDRRVFVTGRSMMDNVKMAIEQGYLDAPDDILASLDKMKKLPPERIAIITTGAQGEPTSALVRMANRDHRHIEIQAGDTVVLSSSAIPGNELLINRTIDNLYRLGANVLFSRIANVHVRGHAAQEELKLMIGLAKPQVLRACPRRVPAPVDALQIARVDGHSRRERRSRWRTATSWRSTREAPELREGPPPTRSTSTGSPWGSTSIVLRDRKHLAGDGVIVAIVTMDKHTGKPIGRPDVISRGFVEDEMSDGLMERHET